MLSLNSTAPTTSTRRWQLESLYIYTVSWSTPRDEIFRRLLLLTANVIARSFRLIFFT